MPKSIRAQLRRGMYFGLRIAVGVIVLGTVLLFIFQDRLTWFPRSYARGQVENFFRPLVALGFHTAQGSQAAYYAPPRDGRALPAALWVLFAGNGSLALEWDDIIRGDPDPDVAFLFIDYPGYGSCEGKPSPASIRENARGAMDALARHVGQPDGPALEKALTASGARLAVMGHSMGTGAALDLAVQHPMVSRIILVSPYTSLRDMARGVVGWPLCWLLRGNFDNCARLDELAARVNPPAVFIFHGDHDTIVPQAMGRSLAAAHLNFVCFTSVPGGGHDDAASLAAPQVLAALRAR